MCLFLFWFKIQISCKLTGIFHPFVKISLNLFNSINNKPEFQDFFLWYVCQVALWYLIPLLHPTLSLVRPQELGHKTRTTHSHEVTSCGWHQFKSNYSFCYEISFSSHTHILRLFTIKDFCLIFIFNFI